MGAARDLGYGTPTPDTDAATFDHTAAAGTDGTFTIAVPGDVTGQTVTYTAWTNPLAPDLTRTTADGHITAAYDAPGDTTTITVTLDAAATATLSGRYHHAVALAGQRLVDGVLTVAAYPVGQP